MLAQPTEAPYCTLAQPFSVRNTHSTAPLGMEACTPALRLGLVRRFSVPLHCTVAHWLMVEGVSEEEVGGVPSKRSAEVGA